MSEILQFGGFLALLLTTWQVFKMASDVGEIKANTATLKEDLKKHDDRITKLERDRRPDGVGLPRLQVH